MPSSVPVLPLIRPRVTCAHARKAPEAHRPFARERTSPLSNARPIAAFGPCATGKQEGEDEAVGGAEWYTAAAMRPAAAHAPVLSLALALALAACTGTGKREAASLAEAVDRYRRADDASKEAQGRAVDAVACTDPRVCDAKQACLAAIEPTTRALALKDEVTRRLGDLEQKRLAPDSPEAQALPAKLDDAERLLKEGRAKMTACDARLAELRTQLGP
jgi:hypothetical protein